MLVVITIIMILGGLSVGGFNMVMTRQANKKAEIQIKLLENAIEEYKLDNGSYPASTGSSNDLYIALFWDSDSDGDGVGTDDDQKIYLADLDPENNGQGWTEGTGATATIVDPWGAEYIYRIASDLNAVNPDFDLFSTGKDIDEAGDDITNF